MSDNQLVHEGDIFSNVLLLYSFQDCWHKNHTFTLSRPNRVATLFLVLRQAVVAKSDGEQVHGFRYARSINRD